MARYMDKLPSVISCCFCCFLRAGSVMIALSSFIGGLILAPNLSHTHGFWDINGALSTSATITDTVLQMSLGLVSIALCICSVALLVGALCNMPGLIEFYQWGAVFYSASVFIIFLTLAGNCLVAHGDCVVASGTLLIITILNVLITFYFVMVVNSLRMSMIYIASDSLDV